MPNKLTLLDLALRAQGLSQGRIGIIESLVQTNPLLGVMPFTPIAGSILPYTRRVGLPTVGWRGFNQGVTKSKSKLIPVSIECKYLSGRSVVDRRIAMRDPRGVNVHRSEEDAGFASAISNTFNGAVYYGNKSSNPNEIDGVSTILDTIAGSCINGTGSGTVRSIYAFAFGDVNTAQGRIKGVEGLLANGMLPNAFDMGLHYENDLDGNPYPAFFTEFEFEPGLAVYDTRAVGRIANLTSSAKPTIPLFNQLFTAMYPFKPDLITCDKTTYNWIQDLKGSTFTTVQVGETELFKRVLTFDGVRIEIDENITTESVVS